MDALLSVGNWLLPLGYLALMIDYGATFILRVRTHARNPGILLVALGHLLLLILRGFDAGGLALGSIPELLSVIALSCTVVYGVTELICKDRRAGVFVFLLVFLLEYSSAISLAGGGAAHVRTGWGLLHFVPASLAYTAMAFAAVYGLLYIVGQRNLKRHQLGLLFDRLPPLELLGRTSWYALLVGLGFISIAIVTGAVFHGRGGQAAHPGSMEPKILVKIITGLVAWVVCATAVFGKWLGKWSMSRVSRIALVGFAVVVVLFVASMRLS